MASEPASQRAVVLASHRRVGALLNQQLPGAWRQDAGVLVCQLVCCCDSRLSAARYPAVNEWGVFFGVGRGWVGWVGVLSSCTFSLQRE